MVRSTGSGFHVRYMIGSVVIAVLIENWLPITAVEAGFLGIS